MLQVEAIRKALGRVLAERADAVLIGPDVGVHGGPYCASSGLQETFGASRVLDMPRNASAIFGIARGLALAGRPVVCELAPEDAERAAAGLALDASRWLEQQRTLVDASWGVAPAVASKRSAGPIGPIVVRIPVATDSDVEGVLLRHGAPARVVVPARPVDVWQAIVAGVRAAGTVTFVLEHEDLYRGHDATAVLPEPDHDEVDVAFPEIWREVRGGDDLVIITWGAGVMASVQAAEILGREGFGVAVIDAVEPGAAAVDEVDGDLRERMETAGERGGRLLVVVDSGRSAGDRLARALSEVAFLSLEAPVRVVRTAGGPAAIAAAARRLLDY